MKAEPETATRSQAWITPSVEREKIEWDFIIRASPPDCLNWTSRTNPWHEQKCIIISCRVTVSHIWSPTRINNNHTVLKHSRIVKSLFYKIIVQIDGTQQSVHSVARPRTIKRTNADEKTVSVLPCNFQPIKLSDVIERCNDWLPFSTKFTLCRHSIRPK